MTSLSLRADPSVSRSELGHEQSRYPASVASAKDFAWRLAPCSVYAVAKAAERNYSNVHTDVTRLEDLGLIERTDEGQVSVPYESVEILLPLAQVA